MVRIETLLGLLAISLSLYSIYKQRLSIRRQQRFDNRQQRLEERIARKEELRQLAKDLEEVIEWLEKFEENLTVVLESNTVPYHGNHHSLRGCLYHLCKDILGYKHSTGEAPLLNVSIHYWDEEEEVIPINSVEEAMSLYDDFRSPVISLSLDDEASYAEEKQWCHLSTMFNGGRKYRVQIPGFKEEYGDAMNEFAPDLLKSIDDHIDNIERSVYRTALNKEPYITVDPEEYDNVDEMVHEIFQTVLVYDGFKNDVKEISKFIDEVKEVRQMILQTSFS